MKLKLFQDENIEEERVEVYYKEHTELINAMIMLVQGEKPELIGTYNEEKQVLDLEQIFYFETIEKRCFAYLEKKVIEVRYTLMQIEEALEEYGFIRINKSNVVNIYKIERINSAPNMRIMVVLTNGEQLIINRHYKKAFETYLKKKRRLV